MKALVLIFLLSFTSFALFAEELVPLGKAKSELGEIYLYKGSYDSLETLVVAKSKSDPNANYISGESSMEALLRVFPLQFKGSEKIYIVSVWTKGVHGEQVRILDPMLEKMEVARFKSAWAVELEVKGDKLIIKGKGDALASKDADSTYQEFEDLVEVWSP